MHTHTPEEMRLCTGGTHFTPPLLPPAAGSEDEGTASRQTSVEIPPEARTDIPAEVVLGEDMLFMQVACGLLHTGEGKSHTRTQLHHWLGKSHASGVTLV